MIPAFAYARVSSREQEREGYSIPAQRKLLSGYARVRGFSTKHEFIDIESAKNPGRKGVHENAAPARSGRNVPRCHG
jgi:DNA invertase Pin-like site-specific DNA recombinase